ncbi:MAG: AAA family ATPase [Rhodocyclaceae bacterium]|nr:AAA family ATPase [Rhodocyclaceae bacterium]
MYIKSIEVENLGPIQQLKIELPMHDDRPRPLIIVGENGTGKSILLSHLVNSLIVGKQEVFDDTESEKGKAYKYRSPTYIQSGRDYSYSSVRFDDGIEVEECQLIKLKADFETELGYTPARKLWADIQPTEASVFKANFKSHTEKTSILFKSQCCVYFPVNRFEEPAWLNLDNLRVKANYSDLKHIERYSNRNIVCTSPLKTNKDWLLDVIFDRQAFDVQIHNIGAPQQGIPVGVPLFGGYKGQSTSIYAAVLNVLKVILREQGNIRLGAGQRKNRQIAVMKDEQMWVPNLFQLSTGEVQLLNLFLSIVRDYDLSDGKLESLNDIKGIVIIDEIDSHLHTIHQKEVLPELIASFPNVQFIITTHSPLFLLGMEEKFGSENYRIVNMPEGEVVAATDFSEFNAAYEIFMETARHRLEIQNELIKHAKPIVFVEGDYDIRYIRKAAALFGKDGLLTSIQLRDGNGFGGLDKIWRGYDNAISNIIPHKVVLLYDCDTNKQNAERGFVFKRVIPTIEADPIDKGIENRFPATTIDRVERENPLFIDTQEPAQVRIRGEVSITPTKKSVNKDEKGNMCDWLCANGTIEDFVHFNEVLTLIENLVAP